MGSFGRLSFVPERELISGASKRSEGRREKLGRGVQIWLKCPVKYVKHYLTFLGKGIERMDLFLCESLRFALLRGTQAMEYQESESGHPRPSRDIYNGGLMIGMNTQTGDWSWIEKGRELLEQGDLASAVESYKKAHDPEAQDEEEARNMLIEARAHLSRKNLVAALESFEEALVMGTYVQRRQALDGITVVGEIRSRVKALTAELKRGLRKHLGKKKPESLGLTFVSDQENLVLVSNDALARLPGHVVRANRIRSIPPHLAEHPARVGMSRAIPYTEEEDIRFIFEVVTHLTRKPDAENQQKG